MLVLVRTASLTSTNIPCFEQKYEKMSEVLLSENFQFLEVKFSIYLNRCVFVMVGSQISKLSLTGRQGFCLECVDEQADR